MVISKIFKYLFGKNKEAIEALQNLQLEIKKGIKLLHRFEYFIWRKMDVLKNINSLSRLQKAKAKWLLLKACKEEHKVIEEEINLFEKENLLINFLNNILNQKSTIHLYLYYIFSEKERDFIKNLRKNQIILKEIKVLETDVKRDLTELKANIEGQIKLIKKDNFSDPEYVIELNKLLDYENELYFRLQKYIGTEFRDILRANSLVFTTIANEFVYSINTKYSSSFFNKLILVHLTDRFPYKGIIRSSLSENKNIYARLNFDLPTLSTIHFSINSPIEDVGGFLKLSWKDKKVSIIIPGYNFPKKRIVHFGEADTFIEGNIRIPPDSYIITSKNIFPSEEELEVITKEFFAKGIRILLVNEGEVYKKTREFCERVGRWVAIHNEEAIKDFAKSIKATYTFDRYKYDSETISRELTELQELIYGKIRAIRKNNYNRSPLQENGLLLKADIIFDSLQVIYNSFGLINKYSEDKRFLKPIAILLNLVDSLTDLLCVFVINEFKYFKNKSDLEVKKDAQQLIMDIPEQRLEYILSSPILIYTPNLNVEIIPHFRKTLRNIQNNVKLMQEFCVYINGLIQKKTSKKENIL